MPSTGLPRRLPGAFFAPDLVRLPGLFVASEFDEHQEVYSAVVCLHMQICLADVSSGRSKIRFCRD